MCVCGRNRSLSCRVNSAYLLCRRLPVNNKPAFQLRRKFPNSYAYTHPVEASTELPETSPECHSSLLISYASDGARSRTISFQSCLKMQIVHKQTLP